MGQKKMESVFDVVNGGPHQLCIQNENGNQIEVEITIKTGEWTESYLDDKRITRTHLHPVEIQAFKVNEMVQQLRKELSSLVASEVKLSD